ncbi:MAG: hypothetical protein M3P87_07495 [Actinomycetota bacterium]|nr:hypothetical protein [Actinomycetota bacterium]
MSFAVLLLLSSALVSAPRSDKPLSEIGAFYTTNRTLIVVAQTLGIVAAIVFAMFISGLSKLAGDVRVKIAGLVVAAAAAVTSIPLILLSFQGADPNPTVVDLTDLTDALLFAAIAALLGVLATNNALPMWIRGSCVIGAGLTLVRAYLGFGPVFTTLDVIAPFSFVLIVVALAGWAFRAPTGSHQVA